MRTWMAAWAMVVVAGLASGADPKETLEGNWRVVSVTVDGKEAQLPKDQHIAFTRDGMFTFRPDGKARQARYTIDPKAKSFDMFAGGEVARGVYQLDGDRLTVCLPKVGAARPKTFEAKSGHMVLTLERDKD